MVNVHLNFEKENFKSKTSITRFKKKIRELVDNGYNTELLDFHLNINDYLDDKLCKIKQFTCEINIFYMQNKAFYMRTKYILHIN